jgi:hypothetical protein
VKPDPHAGSPSETSECNLASILRRIELGDSSVTDLVFWLQMQEDFLTEDLQTPPTGRTRPSDPSV